jgi:hypothetical protein
MEPRALMNANGNLGFAKGTRLVSGELTSQTREELANTPVRSATATALVQQKNIGERESLDDQRASESVDSTFSTSVGAQSVFNMSIISTATAAQTEGDDDGDDDGEDCPPAATPTGFVNYDPATSMSPTTPYLMNRGSRLLQMSCPPKQSGKGLFDVEEKGNSIEAASGGVSAGFPVSGKVEDEKDEGMRRRLEAARRKTMGWRPLVGSPLGRMD